MKTKITAEKKAELIEKIKQHILSSNNQSVEIRSLDFEELYCIHGHNKLIFLETKRGYYLNELGEVVNLSYSGERLIDDGRIMSIYHTDQYPLITLLSKDGEDITFRDESVMDYNSYKSDIFTVINESEKSLSISSASASQSRSKIYFLDKEDKAVRCFKKIIKSENLTFSESLINYIDRTNGEMKEVFKIFNRIKDDKETFHISIMGVKEEKLSKSFGYRTGFKMEASTLLNESDDSYTIALRLAQINSGSYKTAIIKVFKDGSKIEVQKDNGRASIIKINDDLGNESFSLYNTTSKRIDTKLNDKNIKFEVYDTTQYKISTKRGTGMVTGYTVDPIKGLIKPEVQETACLSLNNRNGSQEKTISIIVKNNALYFREHDLRGGYCWGSSFDVKEIFEKKIIELQPGQEEFLVTYFEKHKKDKLNQTYMATRWGEAPIQQYCVNKIVWDKNNEKLYFLKNIDIAEINEVLSGSIPYSLNNIFSKDDKFKNDFIDYLNKAKKNQTTYIFDISNGGFKTEKKYVISKDLYSDPQGQLDYMKKKDQATLNNESLINQLT